MINKIQDNKDSFNTLQNASTIADVIIMLNKEHSKSSIETASRLAFLCHTLLDIHPGIPCEEKLLNILRVSL